MPVSGRRSEELQKKLHIRNKSLKPADFAKEQNVVEKVEEPKDPVEKNKQTLADLRRRLSHRRFQVQRQERREEDVPDLIGTTTDGSSPVSERDDGFPGEDAKRAAQKQKQALIQGNVEVINESQAKVTTRNVVDHYRDQRLYRKEKTEEEEKVPPSQIEVRSTVDADEENTVVSEITTDVRIMSTKGAAYAEERMAGKLEMRMKKTALAQNYLERNVNINVKNIHDLGRAVEQAKMDLRQENMRHGLPYEDTDFRASIDDEEGDSWEEAIIAGNSEYRVKTMHDVEMPNENVEGPSSPSQFIASKESARKLQGLVKEAYSQEGDVFIDATEISEDDLDGAEVGEGVQDHKDGPTEVAEDSVVGTQLLELEDDFIEEKVDDDEEPMQDVLDIGEQRIQDSEPVMIDQGNGNEDDQDFVPDCQSLDEDNCEVVAPNNMSSEDAEKKPNVDAPSASDFFTSPIGFFKSISSQVDIQMKAIQERGLNAKNDMDRLLGTFQKDMIGGGTDGKIGASAVPENETEMKQASSLDPVEKMIESLKNGISKCGVDSDIITENTKTIEKMVAKMKNPNGDNHEDIPDGVATNDHLEFEMEDAMEGDVVNATSSNGAEQIVRI